MFHFNAAINAFEGPIADLGIDRAIFQRLIIFPEPRGILSQRHGFAPPDGLVPPDGRCPMAEDRRDPGVAHGPGLSFRLTRCPNLGTAETLGRGAQEPPRGLAGHHESDGRNDVLHRLCPIGKKSHRRARHGRHGPGGTGRQNSRASPDYGGSQTGSAVSSRDTSRTVGQPELPESSPTVRILSVSVLRRAR